MAPLPARIALRARGAPAGGLGPALLIALAASCAEPAPSPVIRLLDVARDPTHCRYEARPEPESSTTLLGTDLEWEALPSPARERSEEVRALFREHAARGPAGELVMGAAPGAWGTSLPVAPGVELRLSARAELRELLPGPSRRNARFLLVELRRLPDSLEVDALTDLEVTRHWGVTLQGDGIEREDSLVIRTSPDTRALALFVFLSMDGTRESAGVTWRDIRIDRARPIDLLRSASDEPESIPVDEAPVVGPFTAGATLRPSLALFGGERVDLDLALPADGGRLDAWVALPRYALSPANASASIEITVAPRGAPAGAARRLVRVEVPASGERPVRWYPVRAVLPKDLAGSEVTLELRAETEPEGTAIVALGAPRIVPESPARPGKSVLLVSLDTVRSDRVGAYGGPRDTTPRIDALADESLLFETAWSSAPYTLPSHVSLLTGQLPSVHGVQRPANRIDPQRSTLLAELLHERGYATGAFTGGGFVDPDFGFARGFERYGTIDPVSNLESVQLRKTVSLLPDRDMELIADSGVASVVDWLERHANQSFFLFFHTYIAHQFDPSPEAAAAIGVAPLNADDLPTIGLLFSHDDPNEAQRERLLELYDATLREADTAVGRLVDALRDLEILEHTIVVVTSDHGKELGEHGTINHGHSLHRELVQVPLIVRLPGGAAERRKTPVSAVDVLPSLLEELDLPLPHGVVLQGRSFLDRTEARPLFAEVENVVTEYALLEGDLKTIVKVDGEDPTRWEENVSEQSYDLRLDPLETSPLEPDPERRDRVLEFERTLRSLRSSLGGADRAPRTLDPATRDRLEDLGYAIGAGD